MSLKNIWNKIAYTIDAPALFDPSTKLMQEMEKEGWEFKLKYDFINAHTHGPVSYSYMRPVTPDGKDVYASGDDSLHKQYAEARRNAAKKVYNIK